MNDDLLSGPRNVAVDSSSNTLYAGSVKGLLVQPLGAAAKAFPGMRRDAMITINRKEGLLAVGLLTGEMEIRSLTQPTQLMFAVHQDGGEVGRSGRVFAASNAGRLSLWSIYPQPMMGTIAKQPGALGARPLMGGEVVLVEHADGAFTAFDRHTGKTLWRLQLPIPPNSFSAPSTLGTLLATSDDHGHVRVLELPSGRPRFTTNVPRPMRFMRFSQNAQWLGGTSSERFNCGMRRLAS